MLELALVRYICVSKTFLYRDMWNLKLEEKDYCNNPLKKTTLITIHYVTDGTSPTILLLVHVTKNLTIERFGMPVWPRAAESGVPIFFKIIIFSTKQHQENPARYGFAHVVNY